MNDQSTHPDSPAGLGRAPPATSRRGAQSAGPCPPPLERERAPCCGWGQEGAGRHLHHQPRPAAGPAAARGAAAAGWATATAASAKMSAAHT